MLWTAPLLIFAVTTVVVPALCLVSSVVKTKEKSTRRNDDENEEGSDVRLENGEEETKVEMKEDGESGSTLESNLTKVAKKSTTEETSGILIAGLDCIETFYNLTPTERLYAHHSAKAYFEGALIVFLQSSPDVAGIFVVLFRLFWFDSVAELREKAVTIGFTESEWREFITWSATKLTVRGIHFIPKIAHARLWKLIAASTAASIFPDLLSMYESVEKAIFSKLPAPAKPGFPSDGIETNAITKKDYDLCNSVLMKKHLMRSNCRFYKEDVDGEKILRIKVASTDTTSTVDSISGVKVQIEKGDFAKILQSVCIHLRKASERASSILQKGMISKYSTLFQTGELENGMIAHQLWLLDRNPIVRSQFFFRENNKGPPDKLKDCDSNSVVSWLQSTKKQRKSAPIWWRKLIAYEAVCLRIEQCLALRKLCQKPSDLLGSYANGLILEKLPWGKAYEKDKYVKPDFAVLDIIANGFSGVLKGHNFTNDVTMGRSQVFSNVISAIPMSTEFIKEQDQELLRDYDRNAHEVFTGLHELFGHGSGKRFKKNENGSFNFDKENTMDILTGCKVTSWYEPNQSYVSVFGNLAVAFEECRAYAVAYLLCCDTEVLETLGYKGASGQSLKYVIWLRQLREGLKSLTAFDFINWKWEDTKTDLKINLDKSKIDSVGMPAVRIFLKKLQAYQSTADVMGARVLFSKYSIGLPEQPWIFICIRQEIRNGFNLLFVQPNTVVNEEGDAELVTYEETAEGVIQSVIDRYTLESVANLEELWKAEKK